MIKAICIKCGEKKNSPFIRCGKCHYKPKKEDREYAKCVYLSNKFYIDKEDRFQNDSDLKNLSKKIRNGNTDVYREDDLQKLIDEYRKVRQLKPIDALKFALFGIPFLILPVIAVIIILLKNCH